MVQFRIRPFAFNTKQKTQYFQVSTVIFKTWSETKAHMIVRSRFNIKQNLDSVTHKLLLRLLTNASETHLSKPFLRTSRTSPLSVKNVTLFDGFELRRVHEHFNKPTNNLLCFQKNLVLSPLGKVLYVNKMNLNIGLDMGST